MSDTIRDVTKKPKVEGHWIGKTTAGVICGFIVALALSGLLVRLAPSASVDAAKAETAMLFVPLVWTGVFSVAYLFRSGLRAWLWLGAASLATLALFEICK
jgi:predicted membrane channel-forming protein YqfA (hemolysin III family)